MSSVEEGHDFLIKQYETSLRKADEQLRTLAATIDAHEIHLASLKQQFAETSLKRKFDEEGMEKVKRLKSEAATSALGSRLGTMKIQELKAKLNTLTSTLKFNQGLQRSSCDFQHRVAAYRRQLQLRLGETGMICHLRKLMWQFLFDKMWYGNNIRLGANTQTSSVLSPAWWGCVMTTSVWETCLFWCSNFKFQIHFQISNSKCQQIAINNCA